MAHHLLVTGKDHDLSDLVKKAFIDSELDVVRATTVSLALFLAQKNLPLLTISEPSLLDGDVRVFLQEMRADSELATIPFVVVCDQTVTDEERAKLSQAGADKVISKSLAIHEFRKELAMLIRPSTRQRTLKDDESTE
jgi:DNA-binding response OmpR family regulator